MDWNDIERIRTRFIRWKMDPANLIGTFEGGDGKLVAINHVGGNLCFSPRDPVIRKTYVLPGRTMLGAMIDAWIGKSRVSGGRKMPEDFVAIFPKTFESVPVRYYYQPPQDATPVPSSDHARGSAPEVDWQASSALAERFCEEFWKGPGIIDRAVGPVTICSVSGYGLNAAGDAPTIIVTCVTPDDPDATASLNFPRTYGGLEVEYRAFAGGAL